MTPSPAIASSPRPICVRPFTEADISEVADLHRRVWNLADALSPKLLASYRTWLTDVFLSSPWRDERVSPLVCQADDGRLVGFLGVMPQRMSFNGQPVQVAIVSNFVVDPKFRGRAGLQLFNAFLAGPHDLAIADEASSGARKLWERQGGTTSIPYSMHWYDPLRPCHTGLLALKKMQIIPPLLQRLRPGNDLFFVFNQGWVQDPARHYEFFAQDSKLSGKVQYTFRF